MPRDAAVLARSSVRGALPLLHADAPLPLRAVPRKVYASPDSSRRLDRALDEVVRGPRPRELDRDANPRVLLGELVHNPAKSILILIVHQVNAIQKHLAGMAALLRVLERIQQCLRSRLGESLMGTLRPGLGNLIGRLTHAGFTSLLAHVCGTRRTRTVIVFPESRLGLPSSRLLQRLGIGQQLHPPFGLSLQAPERVH